MRGRAHGEHERPVLFPLASTWVNYSSCERAGGPSCGRPHGEMMAPLCFERKPFTSTALYPAQRLASGGGVKRFTRPALREARVAASCCLRPQTLPPRSRPVPKPGNLRPDAAQLHSDTSAFARCRAVAAQRRHASWRASSWVMACLIACQTKMEATTSQAGSPRVSFQ